MNSQVGAMQEQKATTTLDNDRVEYEAPQIHTYSQAEIFELLGPAQGVTGDITPDEGEGLLGG